jgi:tRNA threonylcarbamoyladenosine biosynthesis protein TsaB
MTSRALCKAEVLLARAREIGPLLAIDTGSPVLSLAIASHGRILAELARPPRSHAADLPSAVDEVLSSGGLEQGHLSAVAVALGPGSFTGLRVGLSYAKGVALALKCPLVGVASLDALAVGALEMPAIAAQAKVCCLLDARRGDVYAALYQVVPDGLEKICDDSVTNFENLVGQLSGDVILVGDAIVQKATTVMSLRNPRVTAQAWQPPGRGRLVAALGAARVASGGKDVVATLEPLYTRPPQATPQTELASGPKGPEVLWSTRTSSLFSNMQPTMRN